MSIVRDSNDSWVVAIKYKNNKYIQTSSISRTLVDYKIVYHSDVACQSTPTTSSFATEHLASMD